MVKNEWLNQNENNDEKIYNRGNADSRTMFVGEGTENRCTHSCGG